MTPEQLAEIRARSESDLNMRMMDSEEVIAAIRDHAALLDYIEELKTVGNKEFTNAAS